MLLRSLKFNENNNGKIGNILNLSPVYARSSSPKDLLAKKNAEALHVNSFLYPTVYGKYSEYLIQILEENDLLPNAEENDNELLAKGKVDFLGVNYYQPIRVKEVPTDEINKPAVSLNDFSRHYDWPEKRMNKYRGWEIYPEGIYDLAMTLKNDFGNIPFYISENGMGVADEERFMNDEGIIQDDYRIEFIADHLSFVQKSIADGANIFGYHLWTFIDCWSWLNGYRNRYGFYRYDLKTGERSPKKSAFWIRDVIKNNQLPDHNIKEL